VINIQLFFLVCGKDMVLEIKLDHLLGEKILLTCILARIVKKKVFSICKNTFYDGIFI